MLENADIMVFCFELMLSVCVMYVWLCGFLLSAGASTVVATETLACPSSLLSPE